MQYLSKAYSYYSGINPATLSGAIDVIVVRTTDENGEDHLAGSPFHVRFGKLQVLRAGEKRVTLRLPNNLPPPHVAPFVMKVGETGEAFFVLETDEEVPAELLTSPVVMATDAEPLPPTPSQGEPTPDPSGSLTNHPFGATEHQVAHDGHDDGLKLPEVEPLDLDGGAPLSPSTSRRSQHGRKESNAAPQGDTSPPNPLEAQAGEEAQLPVRNYKLKYAEHDSDGDVDLPKVPKGAADGPRVKYGKDIVLDMEGYHKDKRSIDQDVRREKEARGEIIGDDEIAKSKSAPVTPPEEPPAAPQPILAKQGTMLTESPAESPAFAPGPSPLIPTMPQHNRIQDEHVEEFVDDLMSSAGPSSKRRGTDLSAHLASMCLDDKRPRSPSPEDSRRFERAKTEPPEISRPTSPTGGDRVDATQMDLAWDWGLGEMEDEGLRPLPHRAGSLPAGGAGMLAPRAKLQQVDDDPYTFMLTLDDRVHLFELSLGGKDGMAPEGKASAEEREAFEAERVSYQRFMDDEVVVDDPHLIVRYKGLYLSWTTAYQLLFALTMYRHSMVAMPTTQKQPARSSGYWSRWWRRAEPEGEELTRVHSQPMHPGKELTVPHPPAKALTNPPTEVPTPVSSPPPPAPLDDDKKHYAKTLRLTSDQLKSLNLKAGPNTIQFSVTSSYSGYAVVSARIFLWEETDQVIISDIDGTITKSDALGHLYAAIGRDWTHVGIANLYTDICNNGYKMIYLTARAIGQAETTRDYLKTIAQGEYRMPEGPVIMSPDRLMASLHREVILRKPELFKMACLRDIQRLFGKHAKDVFFAGFGNRITDAMSYRSVGIPSAKIYTIDSTGVIKTELLQSSHKGSYVGLNDLVNEVFPPVKTKERPEFTDFTYWRDPIPEVQLPDFSPPSPALSARSDTSGGSRLSVLGRIAGLSRRGSRSPEPISPGLDGRTRPSSPLGTEMVPDIGSDYDSEDDWRIDGGKLEPKRDERRERKHESRPSSMPGSFDEGGDAFPEDFKRTNANGFQSEDGDTSTDRGRRDHEDEEEDAGSGSGDYDDDAIFDDDILATGEMANVPF